MSIATDATIFHVRIRFTDGLGNFSKAYDTAEIDLSEEDAEDPEIEFPFAELMDGEELTGRLYNDATYEDAYVRLTEDDSGQKGAIAYSGNVPSDFKVEFEYFYATESESTPADAVFFYFNCDVRPIAEAGVTQGNVALKGYDIGISEYNEEITIYYGSHLLYNIHKERLASTWLGITIYVSNQNEDHNTRFWIYEGEDLLLYYEDVFYRNLTGTKLGLGARTGGLGAEHRVRNLSIVESQEEMPDVIPPDVEDFRLFSWGKRVWATWKYQPNYQTNVELQSLENEEDPSWSNIIEGYVPNGVNEV